MHWLLSVTTIINFMSICLSESKIYNSTFIISWRETQKVRNVQSNRQTHTYIHTQGGCTYLHLKRASLMLQAARGSTIIIANHTHYTELRVRRCMQLTIQCPHSPMAIGMELRVYNSTS